MKRATFFDAIRPIFGGKLTASQVSGMEGILDAFEQVGDGYRDTLAYALATAFHETGQRMVPVREGFAKTDAGARKAVAALARKRGPNSPPARYGQGVPPHGHAYYGRGHVQLTWIDNYRDSSADAGVDLVANPDAMLDPTISARVLVRGIMDGRWNGQGKGIRAYAEADGNPDMDRDDFEAARRTVNVLDKAAKIAGYALAFEAALDRAGVPEAAELLDSPAAPEAPAEPARQVQTAPGGQGLLARLLAWALGIIKGRG